MADGESGRGVLQDGGGKTKDSPFKLMDAPRVIDRSLRECTQKTPPSYRRAHKTYLVIAGSFPSRGIGRDRETRETFSFSASVCFKGKYICVYVLVSCY